MAATQVPISTFLWFEKLVCTESPLNQNCIQTLAMQLGIFADWCLFVSIKRKIKISSKYAQKLLFITSVYVQCEFLLGILTLPQGFPIGFLSLHFSSWSSSYMHIPKFCILLSKTVSIALPLAFRLCFSNKCIWGRSWRKSLPQD